jgi:hypothetical protein
LPFDLWADDRSVQLRFTLEVGGRTEA